MTKTIVVAAVFAGVIFMTTGLILSRASAQATSPAQKAQPVQKPQDAPATRTAASQPGPLDPALDQVLQKVDLTAEQRALVEQALALEFQRWRLWQAAHLSELQKLADDAGAAAAAHDRQSVDSIQQKHHTLLDSGPRKEETWRLIQSLLTYEQQEKLKEIQPPPGTMLAHRVMDRSGEPGINRCTICHTPHYPP